MKLSDITFQKVYFINCPGCNENIVERSDERDVTTLEKARKYAKAHFETEHKPTPQCPSDGTLLHWVNDEWCCPDCGDEYAETP